MPIYHPRRFLPNRIEGFSGNGFVDSCWIVSVTYPKIIFTIIPGWLGLQFLKAGGTTRRGVIELYARLAPCKWTVSSVGRRLGDPSEDLPAHSSSPRMDREVLTVGQMSVSGLPRWGGPSPGPPRSAARHGNPHNAFQAGGAAGPRCCAVELGLWLGPQAPR